MHGFQGFPTKTSEIHLNRITSLKKRYHLPVGYMDHTDASSSLAMVAPLIAIGKGANIIEKHITLNRKLKEEDYQSSLNPDEFLKLAKLLKKAYPALGTESFDIKDGEIQYRNNMKKKFVAAENIKKNSIIKKSNISLKRTKKTSIDLSIEQVLGQTAKTHIKKDSAFTKNNIILKKEKIAACIACRVKSERLFSKPLQLINGKSILDMIIEQLKQSKLIDEIVLAISKEPGNEIFEEYARKHGLKFILGDDKNVLKRIILAADQVKATIVFRVTSEDPFKFWQVIDDAIKQHLESKVDFTYTKDLPGGCGFEIIGLKALKHSHEKGTPRNRSELVTSFINEHPLEFKIKPFLVPQKLQRPEIRLTVDYPEDLILIRAITNKFPLTKKLPNLYEIISLIDKNKKLQKINQKYILHKNRIWL